MAAESSELVSSSRLPKKNLKSLLDARKIGHGGIGVYIENTARGLREHTDVSPTLIVSSNDIVSQHPWVSDFEIIVDGSSSYSLDEFFSLGKRIDFSKYDLYHAPHYTLPYHVPIPKVVTVHDVIHLTHPERFFYPWIAKTMIKSALRRADKVITVSKASRYELEKLGNGRLKKKLVTVSNAVNPDIEACETCREFVSKRFKLDGPYLLLIASNLKPHKGVEDAVKAFTNFKRNCRNYEELKGCADVKLVLVGFGTEKIASSIKFLDLIGAEKNIHLLGRVSNEELKALYGAAQALVVASKAEGFCLPVIEAHAMGTPVLMRPVPAVKELLTSVDICCKDFKLGSLERGIRDILLARQSGGLLSEAERAVHLQQFAVDTVSKRIAEAYHETLGA